MLPYISIILIHFLFIYHVCFQPYFGLIFMLLGFIHSSLVSSSTITMLSWVCAFMRLRGRNNKQIERPIDAKLIHAMLSFGFKFIFTAKRKWENLEKERNQSNILQKYTLTDTGKNNRRSKTYCKSYRNKIKVDPKCISTGRNTSDALCTVFPISF